MIVGAILVGVIVVLGVVTLAFNNKPKTNETLKSAGDMKRMLKTIYKNLEGKLSSYTELNFDKNQSNGNNNSNTNTSDIVGEIKYE